MTREEIEKEIKGVSFAIKGLKDGLEIWEPKLADLEKQLAELEVKVYEIVPSFRANLWSSMTVERKQEITEMNEKLECFDAMEEYKHKLSILNNGWFPDWKDYNQEKYFLIYLHDEKKIDFNFWEVFQEHEDYEYFNPDLSNQVIEELGELWKKGKGING